MIRKLKEIREKSNLNMKDFAEKHQIPYLTYAQWESGRRNPPAYIVSMLEKIQTLEETLTNRMEMAKRIEDISIEIEVLREAGLYSPDDTDVKRFVNSENLGKYIDTEKNMSYYYYKEGSEIKICYCAETNSFVPAAEIQDKLR